jgi:hypothetical protein
MPELLPQNTKALPTSLGYSTPEGWRTAAQRHWYILQHILAAGESNFVIDSVAGRANGISEVRSAGDLLGCSTDVYLEQRVAPRHIGLECADENQDRYQRDYQCQEPGAGPAVPFGDRVGSTPGSPGKPSECRRNSCECEEPNDVNKHALPIDIRAGVEIRGRARGLIFSKYMAAGNIPSEQVRCIGGQGGVRPSRLS